MRNDWFSIAHCHLCFTATSNTDAAREGGLCVACHARLPFYDGGVAMPWPATRSLLRYEGAAVDLILRAKVRGDQSALRLCGTLLAAWPTARRAARAADAIVASPSSLWGRLRGRLDLAAHLAETLARLEGRPVLGAPRSQFWRIAKRARLEGDARRTDADSAHGSRASSHREAPAAATLRLLLVDDVVTTGWTLATLARALSEGPARREPTARSGAQGQSARPSAPPSPVSLRAITLAAAVREPSRGR
jgi:predicted amidophosphoribosyltransferase